MGTVHEQGTRTCTCTTLEKGTVANEVLFYLGFPHDPQTITHLSVRFVGENADIGRVLRARDDPGGQQELLPRLPDVDDGNAWGQ